LQDTTHILYLIGLNEFNLNCYEDEKTNQLTESLNLIEKLAKCFKNIKFSIIFTKKDILLNMLSKKSNFLNLKKTFGFCEELNFDNILNFHKRIVLEKVKKYIHEKICFYVVNLINFDESNAIIDDILYNIYTNELNDFDKKNNLTNLLNFKNYDFNIKYIYKKNEIIDDNSSLNSLNSLDLFLANFNSSSNNDSSSNNNNDTSSNSNTNSFNENDFINEKIPPNSIMIKNSDKFNIKEFENKNENNTSNNSFSKMINQKLSKSLNKINKKNDEAKISKSFNFKDKSIFNFFKKNQKETTQIDNKNEKNISKDRSPNKNNDINNNNSNLK
jgi:hypothetical protein